VFFTPALGRFSNDRSGSDRLMFLLARCVCCWASGSAAMPAEGFLLQLAGAFYRCPEQKLRCWEPMAKDLLKTRGKQGKFVKGASGNPAGRPVGSRNRATLAAQDLIDGSGKAIMRKAVLMAKAGDPVALRLCIERLIPRRGHVVQFDLPKLQKVDDLVAACASVIEATADGRLTLAEASQFMQLLDVHRKTIETVELAVRIELLESAESAELNGGKNETRS
jgi:hypothetical protein